MAYTNRRVVPVETGYPDIHPVTPGQFRRQPLRSHQRKRTTRAEMFLHLAINGALVFGLVQCARTLVGDSLNLSHLLNSQTVVERYHAQTRHENRLLSEKIKIYSSPSGIEELARNYLNMVGRNELPVRFQ